LPQIPWIIKELTLNICPSRAYIVNKIICSWVGEGGGIESKVLISNEIKLNYSFFIPRSSDMLPLFSYNLNRNNTIFLILWDCFCCFCYACIPNFSIFSEVQFYQNGRRFRKDMNNLKIIWRTIWAHYEFLHSLR